MRIFLTAVLFAYIASMPVVFGLYAYGLIDVYTAVDLTLAFPGPLSYGFAATFLVFIVYDIVAW